jgi:hypothetical protein
VASMQALSAASTLLDLRKQQEEMEANLLYLHKMSVASHAIKIKS